MTRVGQRIGIDANLPIITEGAARGDLAPQVARPEIIGDTGAGWVRLNFVLGPWSGPTDTTLHLGHTWEGAYRTIVAGLREKGLNLVAEDPRVSLGFWFCTQDFGSNGGRKWYGLYKPGDLTPMNRKPAFDAFRTACEADLEPQVTVVYTNQQIINAFHDTARMLGLSNPWELLVRAGLNLNSLVKDRPAKYAGPGIDSLPNLTDDEKALIKSKLPAARLFAPAGAKNFDVSVAPGFLRTRSDLFDIPRAPAAGQAVDPGAAATATHRVVADAWNRYGGLLGSLSERLNIDPGVAVAVLAIEAGGRAFGGDGRMIIRFENHIFFDRWGAGREDAFARHFRFDPDPSRRWQKHAWRPAEDEPWREFHGSQRGEWEVFDFACRLSSRDAKLSISMGAPRIMGFNYSTIGYGTVEEMFDAFSTSAHSQIVGFFDFVCSPAGRSRRLEAMQQRDLASFAALYNGPGQAARYAGLLKDAADAYRAMTGM